MAFGSGALIFALSVDLVEEAHERFAGFGGGVLYGRRHFDRCQPLPRTPRCHRMNAVWAKTTVRSGGSGSGMAIALDALIDGIPEAIVIGVSMIASKSVSTVAIIAIFLSKIPEGLLSAAGKKRAGRSA